MVEKVCACGKWALCKYCNGGCDNEQDKKGDKKIPS